VYVLPLAAIQFSVSQYSDENKRRQFVTIRDGTFEIAHLQNADALDEK
jgi:hypothetical protein